MLATGSVIVEPPVRTAPAYGLWSVLNFRTTTDDHWQAGGVAWEDIGCAALPPPLRQGCNPEESEGFPKDFDAGGPDLVEAQPPFTVYATYRCRSAGRPVSDAQRFADRRLLAGEEQAVCDQLIAMITDRVAEEPDPTDPAVAVGGLELVVARAGGLLIMDRLTAATLSALHLLAADGGRMVTGQGTPVVLSATETDPPGLILSVGPMVAYRSEIFTSSNRVGDLLDRGVNELTAIAERTYLLGWDPCGLGAAVSRLGVATMGTVTP